MGGDSEQNSRVTMNTTHNVRVTGAMRIRTGLLAILAALLLAGPAWAADRSSNPPPRVSASNGVSTSPTTTSVMPGTQPFVAATQPFVAATQPFTASSSVANPLAGLTPPRRDRPHRRRPVTIVTVPAAAGPQTVVVQQEIYYPVLIERQRLREGSTRHIAGCRTWRRRPCGSRDRGPPTDRGPTATRSPARTHPATTSRSGRPPSAVENGGPRNAPIPPDVRSAPGNPWRSSIPRYPSR